MQTNNISYKGKDKKKAEFSGHTRTAKLNFLENPLGNNFQKPVSKLRAKPEEEKMFKSVLIQQGLVLDLGVLNISLLL